jgi:uncharacterized protein YjdB
MNFGPILQAIVQVIENLVMSIETTHGSTPQVQQTRAQLESLKQQVQQHAQQEQGQDQSSDGASTDQADVGYDPNTSTIDATQPSDTGDQDRLARQAMGKESPPTSGMAPQDQAAQNQQPQEQQPPQAPRSQP